MAAPTFCCTAKRSAIHTTLGAVSRASQRMATAMILEATGGSPLRRYVSRLVASRRSTGTSESLQGEQCKQGQSIPHKAKIRLQHQATRRWLHSHLFKSPLTYNQEVSAFGDDHNSDSGDVWQLELEDTSEGSWRRDKGVRLRHKDTGFYLISHKYGALMSTRWHEQHAAQPPQQAVWAPNFWTPRGVCA